MFFLVSTLRPQLGLFQSFDSALAGHDSMTGPRHKTHYFSIACSLDLNVSGSLAGVTVVGRLRLLGSNEALVFLRVAHQGEERVDAHEAVNVED